MLRGIAGILLALSAGASAAPRIVIDSGALEGTQEGRVAAFRGIPYAAPPVGAGRWKPPRPVERWTGVRSAREPGPGCPQTDRWQTTRRRLATLLGGDPSSVSSIGPTGEDCLFLNVWTTNLGGAHRQPVMVWLHGGAFAFGRGGEEAAVLAPLGVVVVTLNYRLGVLGFMAHPALAKESPHGSSSNYGLLDQIEALRWVQRNIAAFGGDPGRVTVFGHSAGGGAVLQLLASPLARGLLHRGVSQSGSDGETRTRAQAEAAGIEVAARLGAPPGDPLPFLRAQSADRLVSVASGPFDPAADGWVLPDAMPDALFAGGDPVPLIVGATADEAIVFALPAGDEETRAATVRRVTDLAFICPARLVAAWRRGSTWLYLVSAPAAAGVGAYHGADLRFLFQLTFGVPLDDAGRKVGDAMRRYWVRFAATGDPNGPGLDRWPAYDAREPRYLELGASIRSAAGAHFGCGTIRR